MPAIPLHTSALDSGQRTTPSNHLPHLLRTPSGLAILEIQGTIHAPFPAANDDDDEMTRTETSIGRLEFPLYDSRVAEDNKWMKRVYLYVGKHQRLTGEVKKLPKAIVVMGKREKQDNTMEEDTYDVDTNGSSEELEILEVIKHKIIFGGRPEPVGD